MHRYMAVASDKTGYQLADPAMLIYSKQTMAESDTKRNNPLSSLIGTGPIMGIMAPYCINVRRGAGGKGCFT